jgi:hypothetical protein
MCDMTLEALVEIDGAHSRVCNCRKDQNKSNHCEESEGTSSRKVFGGFRRLIHPYKFEEEVCRGGDVDDLVSVNERHSRRKAHGSWLLTMITIMPTVLSLRVKKAAKRRIIMVTGIAASVSANSVSVCPVTMTTNWTVNPRKKKKSNFRRAM